MSQTPTIVDNTDPHIPFFINPQYVNVTDIISDQAYAYVQAATPSAYHQSVADITVPRWSFQHEFEGTRISLYGLVIPWISGPLPTAQYAVDGQSQNTSTVPNTTQTLFDVSFYTSDWLPNGTHMLTVNVTTATNNAPYLFDYLSIDIPTPSNNFPAINSTSLAVPSSTSTTDLISSTASGAASPASNSGTSIGPVVGGIIGGVTFLSLIAFGLWWWRKNYQTEGLSTYAYASTGQYDGPADPFAMHNQTETANVMAENMAERPYYSDPSTQSPTPLQSMLIPPTPAFDTSSSAGPDFRNEIRTSYGNVTARAVAAAGAIVYTLGGAGGKMTEARMEALRPRRNSMSDLGLLDLGVVTVPPPYAP